jgi:hypothetical protein
MKPSLLACVAALSLFACDQGSSAPEGGSAEATSVGKAAECPGQKRTMSQSDIGGNYNALVYMAVADAHPDAPAGIVRHIVSNQDLSVRFRLDENGTCVAQYVGHTIFEGSRYEFEGKCETVPDGEYQGFADQKPTSCRAATVRE